MPPGGTVGRTPCHRAAATAGTSSELQHGRTISRRLPRMALPPRPDPRPHQPAAGTQAAGQPPGCHAARNRRLAPPATRCRPRRDHPPTDREPHTPRPARPPPRPPADTTTPQANHHDTRDNATQGCGGDMSTPQKHLSTRHYLQTTLDNGRYARPGGRGAASPRAAQIRAICTPGRACQRPVMPVESVGRWSAWASVLDGSVRGCVATRRKCRWVARSASVWAMRPGR